MGVTGSNSGLFSTQGFLVSPVGKREMGAKGKIMKGMREKGNRKERKEGIERDRRQDKKEF